VFIQGFSGLPIGLDLNFTMVCIWMQKYPKF
jgi:hypothetical protein